MHTLGVARSTEDLPGCFKIELTKFDSLKEVDPGTYRLEKSVTIGDSIDELEEKTEGSKIVIDLHNSGSITDIKIETQKSSEKFNAPSQFIRKWAHGQSDKVIEVEEETSIFLTHANRKSNMRVGDLNFCAAEAIEEFPKPALEQKK